MGTASMVGDMSEHVVLVVRCMDSARFLRHDEWRMRRQLNVGFYAVWSSAGGSEGTPEVNRLCPPSLHT
jgi:hypothetical protein